jgi:hypothetical protein
VHLSRPEAVLGRWVWMLLLAPFILIGAIIAEMMMPQRSPMMTRMVGKGAMLCTAAISLLSLPILGAALWALRQGATARPAFVGALAGLMSSGLAATVYATHCTDDSPLFVAVWYTIATAAVTALGAFAGTRMLRY